MAGICAEDAHQGIAALKQWVEALRLPKGRLHGMDVNGTALNMDHFGPVYIKYNSVGGSLSQPGDAMLNGYGGAFRGVYFCPSLPDGEFRQYAVLPLRLFEGQVALPRAVASGSQGGRGDSSGSGGAPLALQEEQLTVELVSELLFGLGPMLQALGASAQLCSVDARLNAASGRISPMPTCV